MSEHTYAQHLETSIHADANRLQPLSLQKKTTKLHRNHLNSNGPKIGERKGIRKKQHEKPHDEKQIFRAPTKQV